MAEATRRPLAVDLYNLATPIEALFETSAAEDFFVSLPWFQTLGSAGFAAGHQARIYAAGSIGERAGLVVSAAPLRLQDFGRRTLRSLTNFYSCRYAPLLDDATKPAAIDSVIDEVIAERPRWDVINLDSLDRDGPTFDHLTQAFARQGWPVQTYFHFGNWYENTAGLTAADYFAARPGQLRNTLKRQAGKLAKMSPATFRIFTGDDDIGEAIGLYEQIYAQSWKESEPFPSFAAALIRATAALGCLRLGIMTIDDAPAAAQLWIVWRGKATIFKLAHDRRFAALSPGSLLTRHVMERVLSEGNVREVDFGRGDDPYKQLWLPKRRERWGIMAFNPRTLHGRLAALRHLGPPTVRRALSRLQQRSDRNA